MKFIPRIFLLLSATFFLCISSPAQESSPHFLHTVEKGQSLYSISSMYGVEQAEIIRLNPGSDEKIYAGQALKIPQAQTQQQGEVFHTIQAGETLYKLTTVYKVSAKAICDANPGLSAENFRIGQVIRIPQVEEPVAQAATQPQTTPEVQGAVQSRCRDMHKVKRKETIFSLSREYGITQEELIAANPELKTEGLKKGKFICIPYKGTPAVLTPNNTPGTITTGTPSDRQLFLENKDQVQSISTIKAALILPLLPEVNRRSESSRMLEYYEGFLLAVDSLKRIGISIDLHVYDSGTETTSLDPILAKPELRSMDIIFGPLHQNHIKPLADFTREHDIRLVIPFSSRDNQVFNNPSVYQVNTPQSYLYSEVYEHFTRLFPQANVIILQTGENVADKADFIQGLRQELTNKGITVQTASASATPAALKSLLHPDKTNIFIPDTGTEAPLIRILPNLMIVVRENPKSTIHLFGYPEWQTYTKDHLESFFELDTYFYSSFYTNNLLPGAINFTNSFHKWYGKEMSNNYPKYGMLGYDTGFFFLHGLSRYGSGLEDNLSRINVKPVQTGFKFERVNNWGGFINRKVFFVRFTKNYELVKLDFE